MNNPRAGDVLARRPRETALQFRLIQWNSALRKPYLLFDLDYKGAAEAADDAGLPVPSATMVNRKNGHAHLAYRLKSPVSYGARTHDRPREYVKHIATHYTSLLRADVSFGGLVAKNPLHREFATTIVDLEYELRELFDRIDIEKAKRLRRFKGEFGESRNCYLFDARRHSAYQEVLSSKAAGDDLERFRQHLLQVAMEMNQTANFVTPLPISDVRSIANSVARWTFELTKTCVDLYNSYRRAGRIGPREESDAVKEVNDWYPKAVRAFVDLAEKEKATEGEHR